MGGGSDADHAMPVIWAIRDGVLELSAVGDYSTPELTDALEAAIADQRVGGGVPLLLDARSSLTSLSRPEVERRARWLADLCGDRVLRIAFLVPESAHRTRIQELAAEILRARGLPALLFSDRDEALRWLRSRSTDDPNARRR
jgi:hypothetical protein